MKHVRAMGFKRANQTTAKLRVQQVAQLIAQDLDAAYCHTSSPSFSSPSSHTSTSHSPPRHEGAALPLANKQTDAEHDKGSQHHTAPAGTHAEAEAKAKAEAEAVGHAGDDGQVCLYHVTPRAVVALIERCVEATALNVARGAAVGRSVRGPEVKIYGDDVLVMGGFDLKARLRLAGFR